MHVHPQPSPRLGPGQSSFIAGHAGLRLPGKRQTRQACNSAAVSREHQRLFAVLPRAPLAGHGSPGGSKRVVLAAAAQTLGEKEVADTMPKSTGPKLNRTTTQRKIGKIHTDDVSRNVHAVILAGGPSTNNPLARFRALPAVELGSNIQLIDIPISNCIKSGINKMYVLTQFNSHTLNTHITKSYPPAVFSNAKKQGFVDVLACHQTPDYNAWYRGSADAVRRNLPVILEQYRGAGIPEELLILSGQAIYRMDYMDLLKTHRENDADITIATHSVGWGQAPLRGLTRVDPDTGLVTHFHEKPSGARLDSMAHASKHATPDDPFEASMGIYVFKRDVLTALLQDNEDHFGGDGGPDTHFGHDVIPHALRENYVVVAHHFEGYWRELSRLRDFYEVNLELAKPNCPISVFDVDETIVSRGHILPPSIIHNCTISNSLIGEGSVISGSTLQGCVVGCNSYIGEGCEIVDSIILGNDTYTNDRSRAASRKKGEVVLGIGEGTVIRGAVVDNNAAVGANVRITNSADVREADHSQAGYVIQDGIVVVLKGAIIPNNARI